MVKDERLIFCKNVKDIRQVTGLSKISFAGIMGIGVGSLTKIENNIIPERMGCDAMFNLCCYLGLRPQDILSPLSKEQLANIQSGQWKN